MGLLPREQSCLAWERSREWEQKPGAVIVWTRLISCRAMTGRSWPEPNLLPCCKLNTAAVKMFCIVGRFSGSESVAANICGPASETIAAAATRLPALFPAHWPAVAAVKAPAAETGCNHPGAAAAARRRRIIRLLVIFVYRQRCTRKPENRGKTSWGKTERLRNIRVGLCQHSWTESRPSETAVKGFRWSCRNKFGITRCYFQWWPTISARSRWMYQSIQTTADWWCFVKTHEQ